MIAPEHQPCFASLVKSFCHRHDGLWAAGRLAIPNANHMKKADQAPWSVAQKPTINMGLSELLAIQGRTDRCAIRASIQTTQRQQVSV
jgi:hypothetical protein